MLTNRRPDKNNYIDPGEKSESSGILDLPTFEGEKENKKFMLVPIHSSATTVVVSSGRTD